jgi:hypothetical protein
MFIPDPDFLPIPDPGSKNLRKGRGHTFFCSHKIYKMENYFIFEIVKKKIWSSFQRINIWVWDPESGIRDPGSGIHLFRIPDPGPGVKKASAPGSGSATLATTSVVDPDPHGPALNKR